MEGEIEEGGRDFLSVSFTTPVACTVTVSPADTALPDPLDMVFFLVPLHPATGSIPSAGDAIANRAMLDASSSKPKAPQKKSLGLPLHFDAQCWSSWLPRFRVARKRKAKLAEL